jgi:hypothetical protein
VSVTFDDTWGSLYLYTFYISNSGSTSQSILTWGCKLEDGDKSTGTATSLNGPQVESLWTAVPTADGVATAYTSDAGSTLSLGTEFYTLISGSAKGVRFCCDATFTSGAIVTGTLYTVDGTQLAQTTGTYSNDGAWREMDFSSPVALTPNTHYVVSLYQELANIGRYQEGSYSWPLTSRHVVGTSARYTYNGGGGITFPGNTITNSYFIDVAFVPASS